jgi:Gram-negative bacterial TonB protein C-terminal
MMAIALLPERKINKPAVALSFAAQTVFVVALIQLGDIQPTRTVFAAKHMIYTPVLSAEVTSKLRPQIKPYVRPLVIKNSTAQIAMVTAAIAKVLPSNQLLPDLPKPLAVVPKPVVQTGAFTPVPEKPTITKPVAAAQVQTGGFGDPNGVKGTGSGKGLQIASLGSFGMPMGPGNGNGTGGVYGTAGVVQSSGFGVVSDAPKYSRATAEPVGGAGSPVEIISKPRPYYTEDGRKNSVEGEVALEVTFTAAEQVLVVRVVRGPGYGLDEQAIPATQQIRFKRAQLGGQSIDSRAVGHIIFQLVS